MATIPAISLTRPTCRPIGTARCCKNAMMWLTPEPRAAGASFATSSPEISPPVAPSAGRTAQAGSSESSFNRQLPRALTPALNRTPVRAAPSPVSIRASTTTNQRCSKSLRMLRLEFTRWRCFASSFSTAMGGSQSRKNFCFFAVAHHSPLICKAIDFVEV